MTKKLPEILAPAGDMPAALAAMAAGADAIYLGLKHFSARMQAENFSSTELARLVDLAHTENKKIYLAMNTFFKPDDGLSVARSIRRLLAGPHPDALIAQDPGIVELARQAGFDGEIHFSTLANITHQSAILAAQKLGASRIILPRELSIDEIRLMSATCPETMGMELFVHGALCYCVSGRCWWSSYMGGKSGLRGRCVQPCRRVYKQGGREGRFFSSRDLSLAILVKTLLELPNLTSWKIEGRKKGPHYVFYTTTAYRLLRDNGNDPAVRRQAEDLLEMSLGRPATRARFLPQRSADPTAYAERTNNKDSLQTSSGLLCGKILQDSEGHFVLKTRMELIPKDYLRIGYEDEKWHQTMSVNSRVPKNGTLTLKLPKHKTPKNGTPVFLIDRREPELLKILKTWDGKLAAREPKIKSDRGLASFSPVLPRPIKAQGRALDIVLRSSLPKGREGREGIRPGTVQGLWLSQKALAEISRTLYGRISWWLPPVIWPDEENSWKKAIQQALRGGARHFVCNSPWQSAFFNTEKSISLTAGPFCNISNPFHIAALARLGFSQAITSPELGADELLALPAVSPLPLGVVIGGYWPAGIARYSGEPLRQNTLFSSPHGEEFWFRRYRQNIWIYPAWTLDLSAQRQKLEKAGYNTFIYMDEHPPHDLLKKAKSSEFNWNIGVL